MISQYTLPEMGKIFSRENRYQLMLDVTVTACEAMADIGLIPKSAYEEIKQKADFDMQRITELEAETHHNTMAFVLSLTERIGSEAARFVHLGLCSADLSDIVLSLQLRQVGELLQGRIDSLRKTLIKLAHEYKYTLMMGRTHGTHAEPITFGLKMALWIKDLERCSERLTHARNMILVGKVNGAVGTFASVDPHVETFVCRRLGLHPAPVTTQILQRDRHAEFIATLAIIGSCVEKFSIEIRNLQRTDIREVEEDMPEGQLGSTSLPHKQRPYNSEIISGLARVLRGNALAAMEDIAVWHEQDASHSSVERIVMPDSCILLDYMLYSFNCVMETIHIYPETMRRNIYKSLGLVFSQRVLLALMENGLPREKAYDLVMKNARIAWDQQADFQFLILEDKEIGKYLSRQEIMDLFDYNCFLSHIDYIFDRANI